MKRAKKIPHFESEDRERAFWSHRDSSAYIELSKGAQDLLPEPKADQ